MRLMTGHVTTEFRFDRIDGFLCIGTLLFVLSEEVVHFFSFQQTLYVFVAYFVTPFLYRFSTSWVSVLCGRTSAERTWFLVLSSSGAEACARHGKRRQWPVKSIRTRRCCLLRMILSPRYRHPIDNRMELSLSVCGTCDRSIGVIWTFPGCPTIFWSWSFQNVFSFFAYSFVQFFYAAQRTRMSWVVVDLFQIALMRHIPLSPVVPGMPGSSRIYTAVFGRYLSFRYSAICSRELVVFRKAAYTSLGFSANSTRMYVLSILYPDDVQVLIDTGLISRERRKCRPCRGTAWFP